MRLLLTLLLSIVLSIVLAGTAFSTQTYCQGMISHQVPAVVGNNGGLVNVTVTFVPSESGNGSIFAGVYPRLGTSTQESIDQAVSYAYAASKKDLACDVMVSFDSADTSYIDGPSAGAALSVMTYALLQNRTMRNDTIITGSIENLGSIGPVGGLYEKSVSAARGGASYFITPSEGIYEMLILRNVEKRYGITILQADKVSDVIGFMLENKSIDQGGITPQNREIPSLTGYGTEGMGSFVSVAGDMVSLENKTVASVTGMDNDSIAVRRFFGNEVQRQESLLGQGYLFSAANEAFLNYIDIATIKAIIAGDSDIPRKKGDVGICLTSLKRPVLTDRNFEWVVGADLRQAWAYDKLDSASVNDSMLEDERYLQINGLSYGKAWCEVARSLLVASPGEGSPIDESAWKTLAEEKINEAKTLSPKKEDSVSRLNIAQKSYGDGRYGAAIFDAVYVLNNEEAPPAEEDAKLGAETLLKEKRASLWGNVYQSHAAFLYSQNQTGAAYSTARFAKELDFATAQMETKERRIEDQALSTPPAPAVPAKQALPEGQDFVLIALLGGLSIFLLLVAVIVLISVSRRKDGNFSERAGRINRAEQKKG